MKVGKGQPVQDEKAKNIGGTTKRLLGFFMPYKKHLFAVLILAALGTLFLIIGPKMLGEATNTIFAGIASTADGNNSSANIDFQKLSSILATLVVVYGLSALFTYLQQRTTAKVAQNTIFDLREAVDRKIQRLPLNYFDTHTHGDVL